MWLDVEFASPSSSTRTQGVVVAGSPHSLWASVDRTPRTRGATTASADPPDSSSARFAAAEQVERIAKKSSSILVATDKK